MALSDVDLFLDLVKQSVFSGDTLGNQFRQSFSNILNAIVIPSGSGGVSDATPSVKGIAKLYDVPGTNIDGSMSQLAIKTALDSIVTYGSIASGIDNQPFYTSLEGYYAFRPTNNNVAPRVYIMPKGVVTGTASKFEMFFTDYSSGSTAYRGFNIFLNTSSGIHIGPNRSSNQSRIYPLILNGDYIASDTALENCNRITLQVNNNIDYRAAVHNFLSHTGTSLVAIYANGSISIGGSFGSPGQALITNGSGSAVTWGSGGGGGVDSAVVDVSGGTIVLNQGNQVQRIHVANGSISGPKAVSMSNVTGALAFAFTIQITNVAAVLTMPSDWIMSSGAFNGTDWTPPNTGYFKFAGTYDGANWFVNVAGPYN